MKLGDALIGVTSLGIDTAPFIYLVERHPTYALAMREIVRRIDAGELAGYSSVVTLTEVPTKPKQLGNSAIENAYRNHLPYSRNCTLVAVDQAIAEPAAELRARHRLRTPDALQIAAALQVGCEAFLTNDAALGRVTELRILLLDNLSL